MEADLVVSLPKLKTHHWVGMTCSLKNMYGTLPGIMYGWPKNVLHHAGIPETVVDINASLTKTIAVVDGIECMEGDGPIMGTPKHLGLIAIGTNLTAVDATCARVMGFNPAEISYLQLANGRLGPIGEASIEQRGERLASPRFAVHHSRPPASTANSGSPAGHVDVVADESAASSESAHFSKGNTRFQSFFMLITFQPPVFASS